MFDQQTLQQIVIDVCNTMLGLKIKSTSSKEQFDGSQFAEIQISGIYNAIVEIEVSEGMSHQIAESMFDAKIDTLTNDDFSDALGETVNMIGGNIKGMIPGDSLLSLPHVGVRSKEVDPIDVVNQTSVYFSSQNEFIAVKLIETNVIDAPTP